MAALNLELRDASLGPQNIETTKNRARNILTAMKRKELQSIIQKYDKDDIIDVI